jgi:hypothetical protein
MFKLKQLLQACMFFVRISISLYEGNKLLRKHCGYHWTFKGYLLTPRNQPKHDDWNCSTLIDLRHFS